MNTEDLNDSNKESIIKLYRTSFPHRERDSIHCFLNHDGEEGRIIVFSEETFIGFACLIVFKNIVNILYLAICREHQGKGYGHKVLEHLKSIYPNHVFIADIEKYEEHCANKDMRKKRELFYLHDDYKETDIEYTYKGVDYLIMSANGDISKEEFKEFWTHFSHVDDLGKYIANNYKI